MNLPDGFRAWWKNNTALTTLGASTFTALFIASLEIIFIISFTALIYSGDLAGMVPQALGFIILGDAILCLVVAILSSTPGVMAIEQDAPGVMLSIVAAGIISTLSGSVAAQFATVTMMIVMTSALTGILLIVLGAFNLGRLVRFLPYPIIGGFLAGTGWLLILGGIGLMVRVSLGAALFQPGALMLWGPGALLGAAIYFISKKFAQPYIIPALMLAASAVFYGVTWLGGYPLAQLRQAGWLLDSSVTSGAWQFPLNGDLLAQVDWMVLLQHAPALVPVAIISVIALLLNSSGLELITKKDINLNHELVTAGLGNIAASFSGGLVGFQDISFSTLNHKMTRGKRLVGILVALFLASTLLIGTTAILYIPKFIFAAVLIYLGMDLLVEWVFDAWFKFLRIDFFVVVTILLVIALTGFLEGIIAGLVLAVVMFAISYSRVKVVKFALSGREFRSRVMRNHREQQMVEAQGEQIHILRLEGFIFFGTANNILSQLREKVAKEAPRITRYILLDFAKVSGIDSTGLLSFARLMQWANETDIRLILTGLGNDLRPRFDREAAVGSEAVMFMDDLDHGLEWCENTLLAENLAPDDSPQGLVAHFEALMPNENVAELLPYFTRREYAPGEFLMQEGEVPDMMYFIESGQVTAQLGSPGRAPVRLETMYGGRTVGEMGFYLNKPRTASVVVDAPSVIYSLSTQDLARMEQESPQSANILHRMVVLLLSQRVAHLSRTVGALERA